MFQGGDSKDFWVRGKDRNRLTAKKYNDLGLQIMPLWKPLNVTIFKK